MNPKPKHTQEMQGPPCVFLCHASEDKKIVLQIAEDFRRNGIDTFFDVWEINPGDSIRRKIEQGLERCSHFLVLLSPVSLKKPWVNEEIDAGLVRNIEGMCRIIPLRHGIVAEEIPPLLRGKHSPELKDYEEDIKKLINFILGVSNKPELGSPPPIIEKNSTEDTGLSSAAEAVVRLFVKRSDHGIKFDPIIGPDELKKETGLDDYSLMDAADELEEQLIIGKDAPLNPGPLGFRNLYPENSLFSEFDNCFGAGNPKEDALRIAADLENDKNHIGAKDLANQYKWPPRRMNPAVSYLEARDLVRVCDASGHGPWIGVVSISRNNRTRRFVRDHS